MDDWEDSMKTAISLPDTVFEAAEALAQELGVSRSELYTRALQAYLKKYNRDQMLHQLNQVYAQETSELDPVLATMQWMALPHEDW
jgi:metal-responsive CopG/Arc/MetJ family transcriptional regulator